MRLEARTGRNQNKHLIYVPILHSASDMGTLAGSMQETYVKKFGKEKWDEHVRVINKMWRGIREKVQGLRLPYSKVKVYQDGLPICEKEKEIIDELAKKGIPNHQIVQWLMHQGATLIGTEDPELLANEYHNLKGIMQANRTEEREKLLREYEEQGDKFMKERDQAIRDRILSTLQEGDTGILFMGFLHKVDELLRPEIRVSYLVVHLPFQRSFEMDRVA